MSKLHIFFQSEYKWKWLHHERVNLLLSVVSLHINKSLTKNGWLLPSKDLLTTGWDGSALQSNSLHVPLFVLVWWVASLELAWLACFFGLGQAEIQGRGMMV